MILTYGEKPLLTARQSAGRRLCIMSAFRIGACIVLLGKRRRTCARRLRHRYQFNAHLE
jgi:hypothetical protein